jgi:hypothetical protein
LPLIERKTALKKLLGRRRGGGPIRYSDHVQGQAATILRGNFDASGTFQQLLKIRARSNAHGSTRVQEGLHAKGSAQGGGSSGAR